MDPNAAVETARSAVLAFHSADDDATRADAAETVLAQFEALDEWLSKGGFAPTAWAVPNA